MAFPITIDGGAPPSAFGSLVATNDAVTIAIPGGVWATAKISVTTAGTATVTSEFSIDGGTNWLASAYAKRLDAVSANPSVAALSSSTVATGQLYEVPLPANATHFRARCGAGGTATAISVYGGLAYDPGMPVTAVLYDVAEGSIGAGIAANVLDMSGWQTAIIWGSSPTGQVVSARPVDDTGATLSGAAVVFTAASGGIAVFTRAGTGNITTNTVAAAGINAYSLLTRRIQTTLPAAGTTTTGRIRVEASR